MDDVSRRDLLKATAAAGAAAAVLPGIAAAGAPGIARSDGSANWPKAELTGKIVAKAAEANVPLHRLPLETMRAIEQRIDEDVFKVLSAANSVKSRTSYGGTAPRNVRAQAKKWLRKLDKERK